MDSLKLLGQQEKKIPSYTARQWTVTFIGTCTSHNFLKDDLLIRNKSLKWDSLARSSRRFDMQSHLEMNFQSHCNDSTTYVLFCHKPPKGVCAISTIHSIRFQTKFPTLLEIDTSTKQKTENNTSNLLEIIVF